MREPWLKPLLEEMIEEGDQPECDCCDCDKLATKQMDKHTCEWCADWFIGFYCDDCFDKVKKAMIEVHYGLLP